jgi:L-ascorbate metabolism protein UlaG (beta-lactamase superfamily)
MHLTWLDSNSWLIELGGQRILLDPWLVGSLVFGNLTWLIKGDHLTPRPIPEQIDLILLSQGLEDHAHPPTLQQLDRRIPVVGSPTAAKVAQTLGYTCVTALTHGESFTLADQVTIQATPGSLVGFQLVENGYLLTETASGHTLYYEPHGSHPPALQNAAPVDVVITPLIDLEIPLIGSVIKGTQSAFQVAQWLKPQVMLPTAAGGDVVFKGLLMSLLRAKGSLADLRSLLAQHNLTTQVWEPKPGDRFAVPLQQRVPA